MHSCYVPLLILFAQQDTYCFIAISSSKLFRVISHSVFDPFPKMSNTSFTPILATVLASYHMYTIGKLLVEKVRDNIQQCAMTGDVEKKRAIRIQKLYTIRMFDKEKDEADAIKQTQEAFDTMIVSRVRGRRFPVTISTKMIHQLVMATGGEGVVAVDHHGKICGSVFADYSDTVAACGPFSVATEAANTGLARTLIQKLIEVGEQTHGTREFRLTQAGGDNSKALALYVSLGFDIVEHLSICGGYIKDNVKEPEHTLKVEKFTDKHIEDMDALHRKVMGHSRKNNLRLLLNPEYNAAAGSGVVAYDARNKLVGYIASQGQHALAESEEIMEILIIHQSRMLKAEGNDEHMPWLLVPQRYMSMLRRILKLGLTVRNLFTLMSRGDGQYKSPHPELYFPSYFK